MSINAKRSYTEYNITTPTTDFAIGFDNYSVGDKDKINVLLDGTPIEDLGYTVQRKSTLVLEVTPAVASGTVRLERETDIDKSFYQFTAGALFTAKSMDENFEQIRHSQQEVRDGFVFLEYNTNGIVQASKEATTQARAATGRANEAADVVADLVVGKVRAQDVSTSDGSTQEVKNTEFRNELDELPPFEEGVLADTYITVTANGAGKVPRTQRDRNSDVVSLLDFGAVGDGLVNNTANIQSAIDYCFTYNKTLYVPAGVYRTDSLIIKCSMSGERGSQLLFNLGHNFKNKDSTQVYMEISLSLIDFSSDKMQYWSAENAGASYVDGILDSKVRLKYAQRVFIGNYITTPNNIIALGEADRQKGTGFWNKNYDQWRTVGTLDLNSIKSSPAFTSIDFTDANIITGRTIHINRCKFTGFSVGLVSAGAIDATIEECRFIRCKIGYYGTNAVITGGTTGTRTTTTTIHKNYFEDIPFCGLFADSFLAGVITDNIFQPCQLGIVLYAAALNYVAFNYCEVSHIFILISSNDALQNTIADNFCNASYVDYQGYLRYGASNTFKNARGLRNVYVGAACKNSDFDSSYTIEGVGSYFHKNGNSQERAQPKYSVMVFEGLGGSTYSSTLLKTNRFLDGLLQNKKSSGLGINLSGNEDILSVEVLNGYASKNGFISHYGVDVAGNTNTLYFSEVTASGVVAVDPTTLGVKTIIKVVYLDAKTT